MLETDAKGFRFLIAVTLLTSLTMMPAPLGAAPPNFLDCQSEATGIGGFNIISQTCNFIGGHWEVTTKIAFHVDFDCDPGMSDCVVYVIGSVYGHGTATYDAYGTCGASNRSNLVYTANGLIPGNLHTLNVDDYSAQSSISDSFNFNARICP